MTLLRLLLLHMLTKQASIDRAGEGQMVRKKLCATLGTFFLQAPITWTRPLLHMAASFHRGDAVPEDQLSAAHDALSQFLPLMTESQLATMLWMSSSLATEASTLDSTTPAHAQIHLQMESLVVDASKIMHHALILPATLESVPLKGQALAAFLNWVNYAQPMWPTKPDVLSHLRERVPDVIPLLNDDNDIRGEVMDVIRDILESYTSFFLPQHMEQLALAIYQSARPRMLVTLRDGDPEVLQVAQLVIAYGIANIQQIVEHPDEEYGSRSIVQLLFAILESPGIPGDDDEVSALSIEFWNTYIEYVNDVVHSREENSPLPLWLQHDKALCTHLTKLLLSKLKTPSQETSQNWSEAEIDAFREFRMDTADLMLSIYIRLGDAMLLQFITIALESLANQEWQNLEAAMYCVNALGDNALEEQDAEPHLALLFSSPLFRDIADFDLTIPLQTRRTAIDMLGTYGPYIERHSEYLPDTLRFLFASLENHGLCVSASKSIAALCSACRNSLTGEIQSFIEQYHRFAVGETSEPFTNEKVIGAIAAIVQAVSPEAAKAQPLSALLDIVDGMVGNARKTAEHSDSEKAHEIGVSAIQCLASIGKGLQAPDDTPIDLYEDIKNRQEDTDHFWKGQEGQNMQVRVVNTCYSVLQLFPGSGEAVDAVCQVLKQGFTEHEPGPFVFPPAVTVGFLEQCTLTTPQIESVLAITSTLIVQHSRRDVAHIDAEVDRAYRKAFTLIQSLAEPSQDPGIAQACIEVFHRMIPRYTHVLLDMSSTSGDLVQPILDFAIKAIDGADLLPKRSAAEFWSKIIKPSVLPSGETVRTRLEQVVSAYGPSLCQALANQMVGRGQRSELDQLCEPLKALIQTRPQTRGWLEAALFSDALPEIVGPSVGETEKRRFVQAVVGVRGDSRKTRDIVKNFYAACRGTVFSYA